MSDVSAFYAARDFMVNAVKDELIGSARDEVLTETPMNRFVAGILYPQQGQRETDSDGEDTASPRQTGRTPTATTM